MIEEPKGWHSRGYLPHFEGGEILQFVTVHLGDALPQKVVNRWKLELEHEKDEEGARKLFRRIEKYLDKGLGDCFLRQRKVAELVQNALLHFDGERYKLISWVVMPNHIVISSDRLRYIRRAGCRATFAASGDCGQGCPRSQYE